MVDVKDIIKKHRGRIEKQINTTNFDRINYSRAYIKFKEEMAPDLNRYEKWCRSLGSIIKIKFSQKDEEKIKRHLEIAHLEIEPWQSLNLSVMVFISVFLFGLITSIAIALIKGSIGAFPFLFFFLMVTLSISLFYFFKQFPARLSAKWRLKASSQMVPAILYLVIYMRHTSNLEKAIAFASEHLQYPLSLDFKKVFYDVEIGKYSSIKISLDNYLETWRDYSPEFIEAFHLIEGSLLEPDNARRVSNLEKALQVVLDGVYDRMLKFTHEVRSPLINVYMLTVVLPVLGIALLPLASAMIGGIIKWYHVIILYNLIIPFVTFYLTDKIMLLRPGGHGEAELIEKNPNYYKYKSNKPYFNAFLICLPFFIIGLLPFIFQYTPVPSWLGLNMDYTFSEIGLGFFGNEKIFDFKPVAGGFVGPFGVGALVLGLFIPMGIAMFFSISFMAKTKDLIVERKKTKQLEKEFNNSLFQLGNRIGNGVPPELVFGDVANSAKGLETADFFRKVNYNIRNSGMSVERAIFDPKIGAIIYYPSNVIATSMRILIESSKKGLKIAAVSLMGISEYVRNIQKISARLKDMLAEVASDMRSNMTFLAPLLSGIVVGLAVMITSILNQLNLNELGGGAAGIGNLGTILNIFDLTKMIPPYFLQIAIGIYLIQIIFILTGTLVTVDSGEDKLVKTNKIAKNLRRGIILYFIVAFLSSVALFGLTSIVLGNLT